MLLPGSLPLPRSIRPRGLAAVLSADDKAARLYDVLAGDRDQPLAPLDTVMA